MLPSRVDRAFARYRRTGDPRALATVFDATAGELWRLAWHLVGDRHAADDLVQTTFLVAIQDARSFDGERRVLPWLCGVLANRALHHRRQARQRREQDVAAAAMHAAGEDPVRAAAANETTGAVAAAVRSLPDPYRQVLLLHLLHELTPKEIAEALARPDATVRVQLHRGLDLLRKALPVGIVGVASAAAPVPVGLMSVRAVVLAKAGEVVAVGAGGGLGAAVAFGGVLAMKKLLLVFGAVALFLLCAWPLLPPREGPAPGVASGTPPVAAVADAGEAPAGAGPTRPLDRREVATEPGTQTASLDVDVTWSDGTPAADVTVRVQPVRADGELWLRAARTGGDGVAHFPAVAPGTVHLTGDRGGEIKLEIAGGSAAHATLVLPRGIDVRGLVVDPDERPFAGAEVWLSAVTNSDDAELVAHSAQDGTFLLRSVESDRVLSAMAPGFSCMRVAHVAGDRDEVTCVLQLRAAAGVLEGRVLDPEGQPLAHARVLVGVTFGENNKRMYGEIRGQDLWPSRYLRTDAQGRFRAIGLPPMRWPVWVGAPGLAMWRGDVEVSEQRPVAVEIRMGRGATIRGRVADAQGQPVAGAKVRADPALPEVDPRIVWHVAWNGMPYWEPRAAMTDALGEYVMRSVMPGKVEVVAWSVSTEARARTETTLRDGEEFTWNARFAADRFVAGSLVDPDGKPLVDWTIDFFVGAAALGHAETGPDGQFRFRVIEDERLNLLVSRIEVHATVRYRAGEVKPGTEPLRIVVPWSCIPASTIAGRVVLADGVATKGLLVRWWARSEGSSSSGQASTTANGSFTTPLVPPGRYHLSAGDEAHGYCILGEWDVARGAVVDIGEHRLESPGDFTFEVVDASGQRKPGEWVRLFGLTTGESGGLFSMEQGARGNMLQPGRYLLSTMGEASAAQEFTVEAGRTAAVRLRLPDGVRCVLAVPSIFAAANLIETWRGVDGSIARQSVLDTTSFGKRLSRILPVGRYTLEVRDRDGRTATTTVDLRATDPPMLIELPLLSAK